MALLKQFFVGFIIALLCVPVAAAQSMEKEQESSASEIRSYSALNKAIYWQRMGDQTRHDEKRRENYENASGELEVAIQSDPESSFLFTRMAEVSFSLQNPRRAMSACRKALKLNPDNADAHFWLGRVELVRRREQEAISAFEKATEINPEHLTAQRYLSSLLFSRNDFEGAARSYSAVVRLIPYDPRLRNRLGVSYSQIGETAKAIEEFNAAVRLNSDYLDPHFHLSYLYARQSRNEEAIRECLIVLQRAPGDERTTLLLGELYIAMDEFDKAIAVLERFPRRRKIDEKMRAEALYRLATAYKGKGQNDLADSSFQKSIDSYNEILKEDPSASVIRYHLAMVYDAKGDTSRAEQYLREYISLKPGDPLAYNYLGYMLAENDAKLEEAVELIREAVAKEPDNGAFRDSLGWAYFKLGDLDDAISELEKAAELIPDDSDVREHLGEAYFKKGGGFTAKAVVQWEKALEIKPNNKMLQQRLEELSKSLE
ncbi:tetratricopeptide repeat protein [Candidatus Poribacteria bacterium]